MTTADHRVLTRHSERHEDPLSSVRMEDGLQPAMIDCVH